jgi:hypothetical protein
MKNTKTREYKRPEKTLCGLLCTDIRTALNHEMCCDKCTDLHEMPKNNFYSVIFDRVI